MKNKIPLSVILPIKSSKAKDFEELFGKAITSLINQQVLCDELVIVHTNEESLVKFLSEYDFGDLSVNKVLFNGDANFANQMNLGVEQAKNSWVSFFEFDDEYASIWFKNVEMYMKHYPDVEAFMPIVVDTDIKNTYAGFTNEAAFAPNFNQDLGLLTNAMLLDYQNFQSSGMVLHKKLISDFGGFKASIKLTFVYEFLLRLTYNSANIMVIPRIGYKHMNMREGSIFWNYKFGSEPLVDDEVKFWLQTAKKEYFFIKDRDTKYEPTE